MNARTPQPLLIEMIQFCREASKWLLKDPAHVISVHCKGGKGRTGVMIAGRLNHVDTQTEAFDLGARPLT